MRDRSEWGTWDTFFQNQGKGYIPHEHFGVWNRSKYLKQSISNREGITRTRPNHSNKARERRSIGNRKQDKAVDDLREQIDMLDNMLSSLVDVLEAKGIARHAEWEKRVKERLGSK